MNNTKENEMNIVTIDGIKIIDGNISFFENFDYVKRLEDFTGKVLVVMEKPIAKIGNKDILAQAINLKKPDEVINFISEEQALSVLDERIKKFLNEYPYACILHSASFMISTGYIDMESFEIKNKDESPVISSMVFRAYFDHINNYFGD